MKHACQLLWAALFLLLAFSGASHAMPNFARREQVSCSVCHIIIPRLNRFGYEYRNAGFRRPETLGELNERDFEFGDMNSARNQAQVRWTRSDSNGTISAKGTLNVFDVTLYPFTGSFGRWYASEGELSMSPEDFFEIENAYVRGLWGNEKMRVQARFGVFHPFEGFGASDRPVTLARPLIQTSAANDKASGTGSTFFTTWGYDEVGFEVGFTYGGFNIAGTVFNGIFARNEEGVVNGFPFQGGNLTRPGDDPNFNAKDFQVFANQFIGEDDLAVSALYYHGTLSIPFGSAGRSFTDHFDRLALYVTVPAVARRLYLYGGGQLGWDKKLDLATGAADGRFLSIGAFGEALLVLSPKLGFSARYDIFDPSRDTANNTQQAVTTALNGALLNGAQAVLEYRFLTQKVAAELSNTSHQITFRVIFIY